MGVCDVQVRFVKGYRTSLGISAKFSLSSVGWTLDVLGREPNLVPSISSLRMSFDKTTWDWTTCAAIVWMVQNDRKNVSRITEEREQGIAIETTNPKSK